MTREEKIARLDRCLKRYERICEDLAIAKAEIPKDNRVVSKLAYENRLETYARRLNTERQVIIDMIS